MFTRFNRKDTLTARAARILVRWGAGVIITALGFQTIYSLLLELE